MEKHKEGMSNRAIAKLFGVDDKTVGKVIKDTAAGCGEILNQGNSAPSVLPLANTEDRSDTRVDADEFVDNFLEDYSDFISLAEDETESAPKPAFDLKAATGFGDDIASYTKRPQVADEAPWATEEAAAKPATPVELQSEWLELLEEEERIAKRKAEILAIATRDGFSLPA